MHHLHSFALYGIFFYIVQGFIWKNKNKTNLHYAVTFS